MEPELSPTPEPALPEPLRAPSMPNYATRPARVTRVRFDFIDVLITLTVVVIAALAGWWLGNRGM